MDWMIGSIVLSVALTVVLNMALRVFPRAGDRAAQRLDELASQRRAGGRRMQVWFPWKGMLVASIVLTIVLNVALWVL